MKITEKAPDGTVTEVDTGRGDAAEKAVATWDGETVAGVLVKSEPDRRFTLAVAYPAEKADTAIASDGHRDFASKEAVEKAAWSFMANGAGIGLHHAQGTDGAGTVVESYVYRGPDWTVKGADGTECVIKEGDWMVGTIWSPPAWEQIQDGRIGGVSMQGSARRRVPTAEAVAGLRA